MASNERDKHNFISWNLREGSGLRNITSHTGRGMVTGATWNNGDLTLIPVFIGGMCLAFTVLGTAISDGASKIDANDYIDSHFNISSDSTPYSYSAIDITETQTDPYVLVHEGDFYRLYSTQNTNSGLEWSFIEQQTGALTSLGEILTSLNSAKASIESGQYETLPSLVGFDNVTSLYMNGDTPSRLSSPPTDINQGHPYDLSEEIDARIALVTEAISEIENGQYGFSLSHQYNIINEEGDTAVSSYVGTDTTPQEGLTLSPTLPEEPIVNGGAFLLGGLGFTGAALTGSFIAASFIGGIGGFANGVRQNIQRRRRHPKQRP